MRIAVAGGTGVVGGHAVIAAREAGHDVVSMSRRSGVDLRTGQGLASALEGVEVVIDTSNPGTTGRQRATDFFTEATRRLHEVGHERGVRRLVTMSIVGIDRVPDYGYYLAKLAHEAAAMAGPLPVTILRATQFHEFPAQILSRTRKGPVALMPRMTVQTVAARTVGETLVDIAVRTGTGRGTATTVEMAGPEPGDLVDLARTVVRRRGERVAVLPLRLPGAAGRAMRGGALLPTPEVAILGPSFTEWLSGDGLATVGA
jgi:uncharacterized protein YbjT (DUF2867 family)